MLNVYLAVSDMQTFAGLSFNHNKSSLPIIAALKKWSLGRKKEISKIVQLTE